MLLYIESLFFIQALHNRNLSITLKLKQNKPQKQGHYIYKKLLNKHKH